MGVQITGIALRVVPMRGEAVGTSICRPILVGSETPSKSMMARLSIQWMSDLYQLQVRATV